MRHTAAARAVVLMPAAAALLAPQTAQAELYTFTDEQGVIHFTNIPAGARHQPPQADKTRNTYLWNDDLGALRKIHRVDVTDFDAVIVAAARYYSLPPALVKAVIAAESSFEPAAESPAGAQGLMQLIPETALAMSVRDSLDARDNIYGGTRYLRVLANRFDGDLRLTLAAYNAGPVLVEKAKDVPAVDETRRYVQRVLTLYKHYLSSWHP
jgi:soluble lytic murein transglycosylase-like protein